MGTAFHGTTAVFAKSIRAEGFKPSPGGMLGAGVYVSRDIAKVLAYGGPEGVILQVRVRVGRRGIVDHQGHSHRLSWQSKFDSVWVPARCGMVASGMEEGCIADASNVRLICAWPKRWIGVLLLVCI